MDDEIRVTLTRTQAVALRDLARMLDAQTRQALRAGTTPTLPRRIAGELFWAAQALDEALSQAD